MSEDSSSQGAIERAEDARPEGQHSAGWRDIASAPRDGTPFLAFNPMVGIYNTAYTTRWTGAPEEYRSGNYSGFPCGFWSSGLDSFPFGQWDCQPTHWMPLPPYPANHSADDGAERVHQSLPGMNQ